MRITDYLQTHPYSTWTTHASYVLTQSWCQSGSPPARAECCASVYKLHLWTFTRWLCAACLCVVALCLALLCCHSAMSPAQYRARRAHYLVSGAASVPRAGVRGCLSSPRRHSWRGVGSAAKLLGLLILAGADRRRGAIPQYRARVLRLLCLLLV